ncbi:NADH-ubiquinone oxidoreductase-F iron-sulfur binding region domain-containing protein [Sebaldella sp. S0638]|uniref:NADH-ubiquinone oxidoreductase-F iron-sulfur binding region domain-containing protein n=1 Tax=Sebaldella sp. S0638 TaxID=2957809 RepID=UPI003531FCC1
MRSSISKERNYKKQVLVCCGVNCLTSGNDIILEKFQSRIKEMNLDSEINVTKTGCFGFCARGPIVEILPDKIFYTEITLDDVDKIIDKHLLKNQEIEELLYTNPLTKEKIGKPKHMDFYKKQKKIALRNCGIINPESIDDYVLADGYTALDKALKMTPEEVVEIVKNSGLRGRGGAGFPTGKKWEIALHNEAPEKYVVCNADEGDPGAFMDRSILEDDPHSIVEAMAICGYAIGAEYGLVYIRAEYPNAMKVIAKAIKDARSHGFLGKNIYNTNFSFDIQLKYGAGAFVCGEETALIRSMMGKRGEPVNKPPFPAERGYKNSPTNVNNVETLANIPVIIKRGAEWFRSFGTENSPGTKVFALAGKINNTGLIEVPMGTTLREIIYEIGGGIKNGKRFKAVQTGGPSGGCLTIDDLDTSIDFDSLTAKGSMMGSGGMIIMDEDNCMPAMAKFYLDFTVDESCGKCTPCRIGNKRLLEILKRITSGEGTEDDLYTLKELSLIIKDSALCGLGQTAPNPVLSTLDKFWDEYIAHVRDKKCPSGQCRALIKYVINNKCIGCTLCARICPESCITGSPKQRHYIDTEKCIKCGSCYEACKFHAIDRV